MSKYASGLSTDEICKLEMSECEKILDVYDVAKEDKNIILGMIKQAYYMVKDSYKAGSIYNEMLKNHCSMSDEEIAKEYIAIKLRKR